jgi:hypothetical protein
LRARRRKACLSVLAHAQISNSWFASTPIKYNTAST